MPNLKVKLPSGADLEASPAPFAQAYALSKAVAREVEGVQLRLGLDGKSVKTLGDFFKLGVTEQAMDTVKNLLSRLLSSDAIERALWPCLARATRNGARITGPDFFEAEDVRVDYLPIAKEVLLFNIGPFFGSLGSLFTDIVGQAGATPPSP